MKECQTSYLQCEYVAYSCIYNIVCSTALIDAGEQVLYLKLNQFNKIV